MTIREYLSREARRITDAGPRDCSSVEEWLSQPRSGFAEAASHVLKKNTELYRRLA